MLLNSWAGFESCAYPTVRILVHLKHLSIHPGHISMSPMKVIV